MFTVIVTEKGGEQRRMEFDKPEVTIGRVQGNDIILPKGNVSKRHSRIVLKDGKFIIVDLKSTNGTYVNGRKITSPLVIKETDKIYIGDFILTVEENAAGAGMPMAAPAFAAPPPMAPPVAEPERLAAPPPPPAPVPHAPPPPPPPRRSVAPPPTPIRREMPDDLDHDVEEDRPKEREARPTAPRPAQNPPPGLASAPPAAPAPIGREPSAPARAPLPPPPARDPIAARAAQVGARETGGRAAVPDALPPASSREVAAPAAPLGPASTAPARPERSAPARLVGAGAPQPASAPPAAAAPAPAPAPVPAAVPLTPSPALAAPPDPKRVRALELQREIHDRLALQLDLARVPIERLAEEALWQRAESAICDLVEQLDADGAIPGFVDQDALIKDSLNEVLGLGPLEDLLADEAVTDVLVNRPDRVLVERNGRLEPYEKAFSSDTALRQVIERLVAPSGRKIDEAQPLIDMRLRDGARLTAAVPPLAVRGACLTLRKPRRAALSLDDLVRAGAMSSQMADFLGTCVAARRNLVICGGAGAGKTTLIQAIAGLVPAHERVVSVEEVAELALGRDHWIALEARPPDAENKHGVGLSEVLRAALRMRPDRLLVGEAAGMEGFELVTAMASAHDGTILAIAAEGPRAALARLESLARLAAGDASPRGLRELVASAAHVLVHVARYADGIRRVTSICEMSGVEGDGYAVRDLFQFHAQGRGADGAIRGRFAATGVVPRFYESLEARGILADPAVFK